MTTGDGAILGNERNIYENEADKYVNNDYVNVKHGFSNRPRAPAPPPGEQFVIFKPILSYFRHFMCALTHKIRAIHSVLHLQTLKKSLDTFILLHACFMSTFRNQPLLCATEEIKTPKPIYLYLNYIYCICIKMFIWRSM